MTQQANGRYQENGNDRNDRPGISGSIYGNDSNKAVLDSQGDLLHLRVWDCITGPDAKRF